MNTNLYHTPDQGIAAFLCCEGFDFLGVVPSERPGVFNFIFRNEPVELDAYQVKKLHRSLDAQMDRVNCHPKYIDDALVYYLNDESWNHSHQFFKKMRLMRQSLRDPLNLGDK